MRLKRRLKVRWGGRTLFYSRIEMSEVFNSDFEACPASCPVLPLLGEKEDGDNQKHSNTESSGGTSSHSFASLSCNRLRLSAAFRFRVGCNGAFHKCHPKFRALRKGRLIMSKDSFEVITILERNEQGGNCKKEYFSII